MRKLSVVVSVIGMGVWGAVAPASAQQVHEVIVDSQESYIDGFYVDPNDPMVVDGVPVMTDGEVAEYREAIVAAQAAGSAQSEVVPGEMWSDSIDLPEGVSKEEADASEIAIAREESTPVMARAASERCLTLWLVPEVCDPILARFEQLGGVTSWLAFPVEPVKASPDGVGLHQRFAGGYIYWSPETGAHAISFVTAQVWERNGWELGWLGYPTGGDIAVSGTNPLTGELNGWVQTFEGGRIYRSPIMEGFQVAAITGKILDRWLDLGGPSSPLGFPVSDEGAAADGVGRFSVFQRGSIYWHPEFGAWEVYSTLGSVWQMRGATQSRWGYPLGPPEFENSSPVATVQEFSGGQLDLVTEFVTAGTTVVAGKEISSLLLELLVHSGLDLTQGVDGVASSMLETRTRAAMSLCPKKDSSGPEFGGVTIPVDYDYWACRDKKMSPNEKEFTLHDYCTNSPDDINALLGSADFGGACARHDMCYGDAEGSTDNYKECNSDLWWNMRYVCDGAARFNTPFLFYCGEHADAYWFGVTAYHKIVGYD